MKLSIVITTRNRIKDLTNCINSIKSSKKMPKTWELIIVDDQSTDQTQKINDRSFGLNNCRIFHNSTQLMMVRCRNLGAKAAKGEYVLFVDDDNILDKNMIFHLVALADKRKTSGMVGPSMCYSNREKYLDFQRIDFFSGRTYGVIDHSQRIEFSSDGIPNLFLIKKEVFNKCGYFDEKLIQTYTELDFGLHIRKSGYECITTKKAIVFHQIQKSDNLGPRNLGGTYSQKAYCLMRNRSVIVARYGNPIQKIFYLIFFSWFWPLMYSLLILRFQEYQLIKLYWRGFFDGITYFLTGKLYWSYSE